MKGFLARVKQLGEQESVGNGVGVGVGVGTDGLSPASQSKHPAGPPPMLNNYLGPDEQPLRLQNGFNDDRRFPEGDQALSTARSDDSAFAIDMVSKFNNGESLGRLHREKLARDLSVSMNTLNDDKEESELMALGSDDEEMATPTQEATNTAQAWAVFQESIKHIDDSVEIFVKKPKPDFVASDKFNQVMLDMYGDTEYGTQKRLTKLQQKFGAGAKASGLANRALSRFIAKDTKVVEDENGDDDTEDDVNNNDEDGPDGHEETSNSKMFGPRGWNVLKRQVNETVMEKNTSTTKLQWDSLKQTVKGMTNMERTRRDLYERYGIVPIEKPDGTMVRENQMLSERAKAEMAKKPNAMMFLAKRPATSRPANTYSSSVLSRSSSKCSNVSNKSSKLPQINRTRQKQKQKPRPATSKT